MFQPLLPFKQYSVCQTCIWAKTLSSFSISHGGTPIRGFSVGKCDKELILELISFHRPINHAPFVADLFLFCSERDIMFVSF